MARNTTTTPNTIAAAAAAVAAGPQAPAAQGSQWAREKARAIAAGGTTRAAHRFAKLADVLQVAHLSGERKLSFAQANERAALRRGETGDACASWRLALQRTRQVFGAEPAVAGWRVDSEAQCLVFAGDETGDEAGE